MPVRNFSSASNLMSQSFPLEVPSRSLSRSSLRPLLMMPPSLMVSGGSSEIVFSTRSQISLKSWMLSLSSWISGLSTIFKISLMPGMACSARFKVRTSRAFAEPWFRRVMILSMSLTACSDSRSSRRVIWSLWRLFDLYEYLQSYELLWYHIILSTLAIHLLYFYLILESE